MAGSDSEAHEGDYSLAVRKVRNWFSGLGVNQDVGAAKIIADYEDFQEWHLNRQRSIGSSEDDIKDYSTAELLQSMFNWYEARIDQGNSIE